MRKITYICNGCGRILVPRLAIKINMTIQKGSGQAEKKIYDFCSPCFLRTKTAFLNTMDQNELSDEQEKQTKDKGPAVYDDKKTEQTASEQGLKLGPISLEERDNIFRMHIMEDMTPEQIAERMNRLPRGIKRTINSAIRTGEMKAIKERLLNEEQPSSIPDMRERGSGVSNAGILDDSYVRPPQKEIINGRRYDVGGVLALARAGWSADAIADERNYDIDVVRVILEKYQKV